MLRLKRIFKNYEETGSLNERVNLYGFVGPEAFLTKTGELGLILEVRGVSGTSQHASLVTVLAWVEVPHDIRMARGLERGGVGVAEHWQQWALDEQDLFARERTRERADVVLDGRLGALDP